MKLATAWKLFALGCTLLGAGGELAAQVAPLAATQGPGPFTTNSFTLNGAVVPNGLPTTVWFEWNTDLRFVNSKITEKIQLEPGSGLRHVQTSLASLPPEQVYNFRLVASNAVGVSRAGWQFYDTRLTQAAEGYAALPYTNVFMEAEGKFHRLWLQKDGRVIAAGSNDLGQATVPADLGPAVAVAVGNFHSAALQADGRVAVWGDIRYGLTRVPAHLTNVVAIASGLSHLLALQADGRVTAWGYGGYGQVKVPAGLSNVVAIAAGGHHSLALRADGHVVAWGENQQGQTRVPAEMHGVLAILARPQLSLALLDSGRVAGWGRTDPEKNDPWSGVTNAIYLEPAGSEARSYILTADGKTVPLQKTEP